jgi:predicted methyltransferase
MCARMRPRSLLSGCFVPVLVFVAACADRPPVFPQEEDIPVEPAPSADGEHASAHVDSPSEQQPNAPPESAPVESVPVEAPAPVRRAPSPASPPAEVAEAPAPEPAAPAAPAPRAEALEVPAELTAIVDAIDRWESDRDLDAGRHPGELLAFLDLAPGMRVAEIFAGKGYTTELLARRVGPTGKVWAQNPPGIPKFVGMQLTDRLAKPVMESVVRVDSAAGAPLPPDARNLDAVVSVLAYHDTVWLGVDRDAMNKSVFDALKKGGEYVIVDHSAAAGHGTSDAKKLHRIEESVVVREVVRAGFRASGSANFLRNPDDARDWNDSPSAAGDKRGTSDRFVLKFVRP